MKKIYISFLLVIAFVFAKGQASTQVADSNNLFAFQLYKHINKPGENLFFSPFSISAAMAMTYTGARNATAKQISHTMHFSNEAKHFMGGFKELIETIESDTADTANHVQLNIANSIWVADSFKLKPMFSTLMQAIYHTQASHIDFADTNARNIINGWVEGRTNNKIKNLIPDKVLNGDTRFVLVNAIYFHAKWQMPFSKQHTITLPFYILKHDSVMAKTMNTTTYFKYYENSKLQVVELPYRGNNISMLIFLPKNIDGLDKMEKELTNHYYNRMIDSIHPQKVKLALPKFTTTDEFLLTDALKEMGMPNAFSDQAADFSSMTDEKIFINKIFHKTFIDITEEGTEATAATAVVMTPQMAPNPNDLAIMYVSHPFVFVIRDNATGCILFMGKINNPLK